jgi:hypothetical protein
VQVAERGIPRSWPDALALLVLVLRAWATSPCTAIAGVGLVASDVHNPEALDRRAPPHPRRSPR